MQLLENDICLDVANKLKDSSHIIDTSLKDENIKAYPTIPLWDGITLSHGYPGLICLFAEMDHLFPEQGWDKTRHHFVGKLVEEIKSKGIYNGTLFSGSAGVCFAVASANLYPNLFAKLHADLLQTIKTNYLEPLKKIKEDNETLPPKFYDLISGITGILAYLLNHADLEDTWSLVVEMVSILVDMTKPLSLGKKSVPGWLILSKHMPQNEQHFYGYFDTGLAHGAAGYLTILAKAWIHGIRVDGHKAAIERIAFWFRATRRDVGAFKEVWPAQLGIQFSSADFLRAASEAYRDGWCYGAPGIAFSLFMAACALKNDNLYTYAINAMTDVCIRFQTQNTLICPSFCHGLAGLLAITHQMYLATRIELFSKTADCISRSIVEQYDETHPFGFKCVNTNVAGKKTVPFDNAGIIDGSIGIILSLLFHNCDTPRPWLQIFLLN